MSRTTTGKASAALNSGSGTIALFKALATFTLIVNTVSILSGIVYLVSPSGDITGNVFGVLSLLAWGAASLTVFLDNRPANRPPGSGGLNIPWWFYPSFVIAAAPGALAANFLISNSYSSGIAELRGLYLLLYFSYFGTFGLGMLTAFSALQRNREAAPANGTVPETARREIPPAPLLKKGGECLGLAKGNECTSLEKEGAVSGLKCGKVCGAPGGIFKRGTALYAILACGALLAYLMLARSYRGLIEVFISGYALYLALIYLNVTVLLLKLLQKRRNPGVYYGTAAAGLVITLIFLLPLLSTPVSINRAEADFTEALGGDWRIRIDPSWESCLTQSRFSLPAYFLGIPPGECVVRKDILYYEGTAGVDQGIRLYFDAFLPPDGGAGLPGGNAVLIRIHGGAWIGGDKGPANMMQMNKYFAARGYTVFDVQYGLTDTIDIFGMDLGAPGYVKGPFTLDDMMRHLGLFCRYLAEHAGEYNAGLHRVFISGGSAGGHLTTALSLAAAGGGYEEILGEGLTVIGFIPFYPANKAEILKEIGGAAEWIDVELLVREDSPPCLIFQGTRDGMVPPATARSFKEKYAAMGREDCAVLWMPLSGHAGDLHYSGYYNQVFLYYMERFMALYKE